MTEDERYFLMFDEIVALKRENKELKEEAEVQEGYIECLNEIIGKLKQKMNEMNNEPKG